MMRALFPDLKTGFEDMAVVRLRVYLLLKGTVGEVEIRNCAGFCERGRIEGSVAVVNWVRVGFLEILRDLRALGIGASVLGRMNELYSG